MQHDMNVSPGNGQSHWNGSHPSNSSQPGSSWGSSHHHAMAVEGQQGNHMTRGDYPPALLTPAPMNNNGHGQPGGQVLAPTRSQVLPPTRSQALPPTRSQVESVERLPDPLHLVLSAVMSCSLEQLEQALLIKFAHDLHKAQGETVSFRRALGEVFSGVRCLTSKDVMSLTNRLAPAATRGDREAQCLLGVLLCFHQAGDERMRVLQEHDGCKCLMAAAESGTRLAMVVLGFCYETGRGVRVDIEGAYLHYHQAARQGYEVGTWFLNELLTENNGEVRTGFARADSCASSVATSYSQAPPQAGPPVHHGIARGGSTHGQGYNMGGAGMSMQGQGNHMGAQAGNRMGTEGGNHMPARPPLPGTGVQANAPGPLNSRMARANSNSIANLLAAHSQSPEHATHIHMLDPSRDHVNAARAQRDAETREQLLKQFPPERIQQHVAAPNPMSAPIYHAEGPNPMQWRAPQQGVPQMPAMGSGNQLGSHESSQQASPRPQQPPVNHQDPRMAQMGRSPAHYDDRQEIFHHGSRGASPVRPHDGRNAYSEASWHGSNASSMAPGTDPWHSAPDNFVSPPTREDNNRRSALPPPVPTSGRQGKGAAGAGVPPEAVSISRNPSTRGHSLTDSLCAPITPASSNWHRGMSIASERSLATLEESPQEVAEAPLRRGQPNYMPHNSTLPRTTTGGSTHSTRPPSFRNISEHSAHHGYEQERCGTPASGRTPSERFVASSRRSDGPHEGSAGAAYGAGSTWDQQGSSGAGAGTGQDKLYEEYMEQHITTHQHQQQMHPPPSSAKDVPTHRQEIHASPFANDAPQQQHEVSVSPFSGHVPQQCQAEHPPPHAKGAQQQHQVARSPFSSQESPQHSQQARQMRFTNEGALHYDQVAVSPFSGQTPQRGGPQVSQPAFVSHSSSYRDQVSMSPFTNGPPVDPRSPESTSHVTTPPTPPLISATPPPDISGLASGGNSRSAMSPACAPASQEHELSPFEAQSMMPFDDGSTPTSQSSQRRSMHGHSGGSSPQVKSMRSVDRDPLLDGVVSRGSSMSSRQGLLTVELRQTLGSRSGSVFSRGSSGGGSMGQVSRDGNGNLSNGALPDGSNPALRAVIRKRVEAAQQRAEGQPTPGRSGGSEWQAGPINASARPAVLPQQAAHQPPAPRRSAKEQLMPNLVKDPQVVPRGTLTPVRVPMPEAPPPFGDKAQELFDTLKKELQEKHKPNMRAGAINTRGFEVNDDRIVFGEPERPSSGLRNPSSAGGSPWSVASSNHPSSHFSRDDIERHPDLPHMGAVLCNEATGRRYQTPGSQSGHGAQTPSQRYQTPEPQRGHGAQTPSQRYPTPERSSIQGAQAPSYCCPPPDPRASKGAQTPSNRYLSPDPQRAQRAAQHAPPPAQAPPPPARSPVVTRPPTPLTLPTPATARPSISASHPWPLPVPMSDPRGDAAVLHNLRAFVGSSTIAVAHALLATVCELEQTISEVEAGLKALRAAVAFAPEVAALIAARERTLANLQWHLAAQREIHDHFLAHASHIARLDVAAF